MNNFNLNSSRVESLSNSVDGQIYEGSEKYKFSNLTELGHLKLNKIYLIRSNKFYNYVPYKEHIDEVPEDEKNEFIGKLKEINHSVDDNGKIIIFNFYFTYTDKSKIKKNLDFSYMSIETMGLAKELKGEDNKLKVTSSCPPITLGNYLERFEDFKTFKRNNCPSDEVIPPYECNKKTLLKLHPDKNPGCINDATERQKIYNSKCYSTGGKKRRRNKKTKKKRKSIKTKSRKKNK